MRKFIITFLLSFFWALTWAQTVNVVRSDQRIRNESAEGYSVEIEAKKEEVDIAWLKFLRELGKSRQTPNPQVITSPTIGGALYEEGILYATSVEKNGNTSIWLGLKPVEWTVNDIEIVYRELEKVVHQFGINFYKNKIQAQIDEAQRAMDAVQRQQQRLTNQSRDLSIRLGNNEQEKASLEKSLEANTFENAVLIQRLENNKVSQDSVAMASEQIKKVIELHKEEQRLVK